MLPGANDPLLPLLTLLYQLDLEREEERQHLCDRFFKHIPTYPQHVDWEFTRAVWRCVKRIMETLADRGGILASDLADLNAFSNRLPRDLEGRELAVVPQDKKLINPRTLQPKAAGDMHTYIPWRSVTDLQNAMINDPDKFRRCEECASVLIVSKVRPDTRYCSYRCASRVGKRRRRSSVEVTA